MTRDRAALSGVRELKDKSLLFEEMTFERLNM